MTIKGEVILVGLISKGNSSEYNYDQLKLQTLESWCQQQQKLGNLPPPLLAIAIRLCVMIINSVSIAFVAEDIRFSPNLAPTQALSSYSLVSTSCPRQAVTTALSLVLAGSCSLLLINTSSRPGPIPLTFCPYTGKINNDPVADVLSTAANLWLAISKAMVFGNKLQT